MPRHDSSDEDEEVARPRQDTPSPSSRRRDTPSPSPRRRDTPSPSPDSEDSYHTNGSKDEKKRLKKEKKRLKKDKKKEKKREKKREKKEKRHREREEANVDKRPRLELDDQQAEAPLVGNEKRAGKVSPRIENLTSNAISKRDFFAQVMQAEASKKQIGTVHTTGHSYDSESEDESNGNWECRKCSHVNFRNTLACNKCRAMKRMGDGYR
jgi:hypothetical protein